MLNNAAHMANLVVILQVRASTSSKQSNQLVASFEGKNDCYGEKQSVAFN